ncbi:MAG: hypothetical protein J6C95_05970 [Muribaculaceae bacterium]|nr:hypothetical protein [Muribaculaceae bacterium]
MKTLLLRTEDGRMKAIGGADSAVLRPGEPVFVPEPLTDWVSIVAPAIRISRLGMNIKPSFARQYYHETAAVHLLMPSDASVLPVAPLFCDRCIAPGAWADVDTLGGCGLTAAVLDREDRELLRLGSDITFRELDCDNMISFVSRYMTLKTGDMIVFGDHSLHLGTPGLDTRVTAEIFGAPTLDIRLK